jgi:chemotaxis family two-component system response regulator Rcp1
MTSTAQEEIPSVLLVEDDDDHAELISRGLESAGQALKLHRVSDGEAAITYLNQASDEDLISLSLILVDLRLPKKSGLELLHEIKSHPRTRSIPAVVLTSSNAKSDIDKAYSARANSYLLKPLAARGFELIMEEISNYWCRRNRHA